MKRQRVEVWVSKGLAHLCLPLVKSPLTVSTVSYEIVPSVEGLLAPRVLAFEFPVVGHGGRGGKEGLDEDEYLDTRG